MTSEAEILAECWALVNAGEAIWREEPPASMGTASCVPDPDRGDLREEPAETAA